MWDPAVYQRFRAERARPFSDLLARVHATSPGTVVDLGCGPGDATATLIERWPGASVTGIDSSPEMIDAAAALAVPGRLSFRLGDLRDWAPEQPVDVVVSNATLQWLPDHLDLLPRLAGALSDRGWLAFQVPANSREPSHVLLAELRTSPRWRGRVGSGADRALTAHPLEVYLGVLAGAGLAVDAWETTYLHVLPGEDAVLEWTRGTALRPVLAALDEAEQAEFLASYAARLRQAYPRRGYGTVLPFRRVFVVARRAAAG